MKHVKFLLPLCLFCAWSAQADSSDNLNSLAGALQGIDKAVDAQKAEQKRRFFVNYGNKLSNVAENAFSYESVPPKVYAELSTDWEGLYVLNNFLNKFILHLRDNQGDGIEKARRAVVRAFLVDFDKKDKSSYKTDLGDKKVFERVYNFFKERPLAVKALLTDKNMRDNVRNLTLDHFKNNAVEIILGKVKGENADSVAQSFNDAASAAYGEDDIYSSK